MTSDSNLPCDDPWFFDDSICCCCDHPAITESSNHWPWRRGYCESCSDVRCDAYPNACGANVYYRGEGY